MTRQDWRLVPLAASAWAGAWLGSAGLRPAPGYLVMAGAVLLVLFTWSVAGKRTWLVLVVVVLVVITSTTALRATTTKTSGPAALAEQGASATVLVTLVGDPMIKAGRHPSLAVARAEMRRLDARGETWLARQPVIIFASGDLVEEFDHAESGALYEVKGLLAPADADSPESMVIRARWLSSRISPPGLVDRWVNDLRAGLRASTALSPPDQAALLPSLVVGDTAGITEEMDEQFKVTSLSHLMAVSGDTSLNRGGYAQPALRSHASSWPLIWYFTSSLPLGGDERRDRF